jgi:UDP:flavonoid glycosyltransferase YjiC (YdhE family)
LRHDPAIGPIEPLPGVAGPASGRRVFAALDAAFPGVRTLMDGFVRSDLPTLVYMRGVSPDARRKYQNRNIHVVDTPPPSAVADAAIVVHHGSADGTVHALAAGRSQFIVPTGLESHLTGQMLRKLGVGDTIPIKDSAEHIGEALVAMSTDRAVSERALALSAEIERPAPGAVLGRIVDGCRAVLDTVTV